MTSVHHGFGSANLVRNQPIGNRRSDPLPRLLDQMLARAGEPTVIERATSRPWASALFEGRRHVIRLRFSGTAHLARCDAFLNDIESVEWPLGGHFVADVSIDDGDADAKSVWIELSALTIQDW